MYIDWLVHFLFQKECHVFIYIVHVEYMDYVYGASRVLTVFTIAAGPYGGVDRSTPPHLIGTSSIGTDVVYYCIRGTLLLSLKCLGSVQLYVWLYVLRL
jgi:hypothetical protein